MKIHESQRTERRDPWLARFLSSPRAPAVVLSGTMALGIALLLLGSLIVR